MNEHDAATPLWKIANGHSGQCQIVAKFLLGLYNGERFPFDLTDFRCLDRAIFMNCLAVLREDYQPKAEIHERLGVPGSEFEELARAWRIPDATREDLPESIQEALNSGDGTYRP